MVTFFNLLRVLFVLRLLVGDLQSQRHYLWLQHSVPRQGPTPNKTVCLSTLYKRPDTMMEMACVIIAKQEGQHE